jgi:NTE family protein
MPEDDAPVDGIVLCLSGGGYRAMLFHVGALWRLNQLAYLPRLTRVSSVSGGSITAGTLGLNWGKLGFDATGVGQSFDSALVKPIRKLASATIDEGSILGGLITPRKTISSKVAGHYRKELFGDATLQALPDGRGPRFVINATNLQSGALWRFSRPYMADYKVGMVREPKVALADAVAASSAFPPVLSPLKLKLDASAYETPKPGDGYTLHREPFTTHPVLSDGGVYDNLGLEPANQFANVLVSDGGGQMAPEEKVPIDWLRHAIRVNGVIDNQVRSLRKRHLVDEFEADERDGTYWGIRSHVADYAPLPPGTLDCPEDKTLVLAETKTRLKKMDDSLQERLINWGYAVCDVAMRRWVEPQAAPPGGFPYDDVGLG